MFCACGIVITMLVMNWRLALVMFTVIPFIFYAVSFSASKCGNLFARCEPAWPYQQLSAGKHLRHGPRCNFSQGEKNYDYFLPVGTGLPCRPTCRPFLFRSVFSNHELLSAISCADRLYGGGEVIQGQMTVGIVVAFIQYGSVSSIPFATCRNYNIMQSQWLR